MKAGRVSKRQAAAARKVSGEPSTVGKGPPTKHSDDQQHVASGPQASHPAVAFSDSFSSSSEELLLTQPHATRSRRLGARTPAAHPAADAPAHLGRTRRASRALVAAAHGRHADQEADTGASNAQKHGNLKGPAADGADVGSQCLSKQQPLVQEADVGQAAMNKGAQVLSGGSLALVRKPLAGGSRLERKPLAGRSQEGPHRVKQAAFSSAAVKRKRTQSESVQPGPCEGTGCEHPVRSEGKLSHVKTQGVHNVPAAEAAKRRKHYLTDAAMAGDMKHASRDKPGLGTRKLGEEGMPSELNPSRGTLQALTAAANGQALAAANGWTLAASAANPQPVKRGPGRPPKHRPPALLEQQQQPRRQRQVRQKPGCTQPQQQLQDESERQPHRNSPLSQQQQQQQQRPQRSVRSGAGMSAHACPPQSASSVSAATLDTQPRGRPSRRAASSQLPVTMHRDDCTEKATPSTASKPPVDAPATCSGGLSSGGEIVSRPRRSVCLRAQHRRVEEDSGADIAWNNASAPRGTRGEPSGHEGVCGPSLEVHASGPHAAAPVALEQRNQKRRRKLADKVQVSAPSATQPGAQLQNLRPSKPRKVKEKEGLKPWFGDRPLDFETYLAQTAAATNQSEHVVSGSEARREPQVSYRPL